MVVLSSEKAFPNVAYGGREWAVIRTGVGRLGPSKGDRINAGSLAYFVSVGHGMKEVEYHKSQQSLFLCQVAEIHLPSLHTASEIHHNVFRLKG